MNRCLSVLFFICMQFLFVLLYFLELDQGYLVSKTAVYLEHCNDSHPHCDSRLREPSICTRITVANSVTLVALGSNYLYDLRHMLTFPTVEMLYSID